MANKDYGLLEIDLKKEFDQGAFEELSKYSEENRMDLMQIWEEGDIEKKIQILKNGESLLKCFEHDISGDPKTLTAFKLGILLGHIECLTNITHEKTETECLNTVSQVRQLSTAEQVRFENAKLSLPEYAEYFDGIIMHLSTNKSLFMLLDLSKQFQLSKDEIIPILRVLIENKFVEHQGEVWYWITDIGVKLSKQLSKTTTD